MELLIRPVQRLPSVALLLNGKTHTSTNVAYMSEFPPKHLFINGFNFSVLADIKKHTSDENPDKITLEKAIESLKEVMT